MHISLLDAVRSRIPLVRVRHPDPSEVWEVVSAAALPGFRAAPVLSLTKTNVAPKSYPGVMVVAWAPTRDMIQGARGHGGVIVYVGNDPVQWSEAVEVDGLGTPTDVMARLLTAYGVAGAEALAPALGDLTPGQARSIIRVAAARYGEVTPRSVQRALDDLRPSVAGIEVLHGADPDYVAPAELEDLADFEADFLADGVEDELRPRGLMLHGPPGTGKTSAARYLAREWSVPLLRLDLGDVRNKWMGESEARLRRALARAEEGAPCVLLVDEVDRAVSSGSEGTGSQLMAHLLWWMQERRRPVYVVMTTNQVDDVPAELRRPGRLDGAILMDDVDWTAARRIVRRKLRHYLDGSDDDVEVEVDLTLADMTGDPDGGAAADRRYNPAALVAAAIRRVKELRRGAA